MCAMRRPYFRADAINCWGQSTAPSQHVDMLPLLAHPQHTYRDLCYRLGGYITEFDHPFTPRQRVSTFIKCGKLLAGTVDFPAAERKKNKKTIVSSSSLLFERE